MNCSNHGIPFQHCLLRQLPMPLVIPPKHDRMKTGVKAKAGEAKVTTYRSTWSAIQIDELD